MKTSPFHSLRPALRPATPLLILPLLLASGISSPRAFAAPSPAAALAQTAWLDPVILGVSTVASDAPLIAQASSTNATPGPLDVISVGPTSAASSPAPTPVVAVPVPVISGAPTPAAQEIVVPAPSPAPAAPAPSPSPRRGGMNTAAAPASGGATGARGGIRLNFQNAALSDVLTYLSQEAGFVIVQEAQVSGTVNVVSYQPLTPDDAVDLLNSVLADKGLTAVRTNRILKIVNRSNALKYDLPVNQGAVVENIPASDTVVTQVMQLRYGEATKLVENLRPLLAETSYISANEGSNAIILTDSQINIRRIAKIIRALDTSVSSISSIQVFELHYADAKALADIVTQLFSTTGGAANRAGGNNNRGGGGGFPGFGNFGGPGGGGRGGGGNQPQAAQSEALQAAVRVVAVADEQSNSLIVSAPDELMPGIKDIITQVDKSTTDITETRIFKLQNADSVELADIVNNLYGDPATNQNSQNNRNGNNRNQQQQRGGFPGFPGQPQQAAASAGSQRSLQQSKVTAVGDPRTNSLVITASHDTMPQIAQTIGRLDATDAKKQRTYVFRLSHADPDAVADVLRGMTGGQVLNTQAGTSALTTRQQQGASLDTSSFSTGNTGAAGARSGR